ncbi:DUF255 domain-containing protein [Sulfurovum sp.]|uniref:thioredoxin family protein n=1 Tax=Sulfurovum sp. TaxID=1969726 RepID=UPI0025DB221A|nr:DUF255 domain-containing protein [Sulfurovum sp.]
MKRLLITFLLCMTTIFSADIVWQKDIVTAFELAKKESKVVMLMVEGEHCRWCKKMEEHTLSDENVTQRLEPYIAVKVMRENEKAVKDLPMINGVPTIFFMTTDKKVIESVVGYFDIGDFLSYIDDVEKKVPLKKKNEPITLKWHDEIDDAFKEAQKTDKKVMILVEDEHCRWCKRMKQESLCDAQIKEKLNAYVLLKIDRADDENMEALPGLRGPIPSFHLFDAQKRELDTLAGYYNKEHFFEYLNELEKEER